jgi:hypothetical protein
LVVVDGRDHDAPDLSIYGRVSRVIQNLDKTDFAANVPLPCLAALSKATRRPASWQGPRREVRGQLGRAEDIDTSMLTGDTVKPIDEDKKTQQIVRRRHGSPCETGQNTVPAKGGTKYRRGNHIDSRRGQSRRCMFTLTAGGVQEMAARYQCPYWDKSRVLRTRRVLCSRASSGPSSPVAAVLLPKVVHGASRGNAQVTMAARVCKLTSRVAPFLAIGVTPIL